MVAIIDSQVVGLLAGDDESDPWSFAAWASKRLGEKEWLEIGVLDALARNPRIDPERVHAPSQLTRQQVIDALDERLRIRRLVDSKPAMDKL